MGQFNTIRSFCLALSVASTGIFSAPAASAATSTDEIIATVDRFLKQHDFSSPHPVEYAIKPLDRRLRIKDCELPLQASFRDERRTEGPTHVQIACNGAAPWRLNVSVTVRIWIDAVVAKTPIARGTTLTAQDVMLVKSERSRLYQGYFESIDDVVGLTAAMPLRNDQLINSRHLKAPYLVSKGQTVTILARNAQIMIRARGVAMSNATQGQRVTVRNTSSGRVVDGVAIQRGTVEVPM